VPDSPSAALSPSQLNRDVRVLLESHYDLLWVEGEVSNFARPSSGHWYFSLKDENAQVRCALFRNRNQRLRFTPSNGDLVRLRARVSLYENRGEFQLIGEFLEPAGAGRLQARFEALRDKLYAEGLFAAELKQALPASPRHLAVITSASGAALQDILNVLARRNPSILVTVIPSLVQGEEAPQQLLAALDLANQAARERADCDFDAIILARGGGSLEDLWAFNDEALARAIVASALPVVVGVGHEVDVTIADFAADYRAPTPSAAAEVLSEDREELAARLTHSSRRLTATMSQRLAREGLRLGVLASRLRHPGVRLREQAQRFDDLELRLGKLMQQRLKSESSSLRVLRTRLQAHTPLPRLRREDAALRASEKRLRAAVDRRLKLCRGQLHHQRTLLESLNPLAILGRGYAILATEAGTIVRDDRQVGTGEVLDARLARGHLKLRVEEP
jgi:exodeoxyribonuclease VII large subunit